MHDVEELTRLAVDYGFKAHKELGPGLLETVYEVVLAASLARLGLSVERQKPIAIEYDGMILTEGFRADLLVEGSLIIEVKSLERLAPVHSKQLLTYLRLAKKPIGLLMNFGCETFRDGLKRIVNNHTDLASSHLRINRSGGDDPEIIAARPSLKDLLLMEQPQADLPAFPRGISRRRPLPGPGND